MSELWRFDSDELRIDSLRAGTFVEVQESTFFPGWPIKDMLAQYLKDARTTNQRKVKKNFRQQVTERIAAIDLRRDSYGKTGATARLAKSKIDFTTDGRGYDLSVRLANGSLFLV